MCLECHAEPPGDLCPEHTDPPHERSGCLGTPPGSVGLNAVRVRSLVPGTRRGAYPRGESPGALTCQRHALTGHAVRVTLFSLPQGPPPERYFRFDFHLTFHSIKYLINISFDNSFDDPFDVYLIIYLIPHIECDQNQIKTK